jgi:exonuclease III
VRIFVLMVSKLRNWNNLNWNIRGLNDEGKCRAIRQKIEESYWEIFCIQETKMEIISPYFFKKLGPKRFSKFVYNPSRGAFGGILLGLKDAVFDGVVGEINNFLLGWKNSCHAYLRKVRNSIVYGPCHGAERVEFIN